MEIKINASFLPHSDPDESLAFFRDVLGFEVRNDVGYEGMRWITVGPAGQPDTNIVLHPPAATPGLTDDERRMLLELMAKGTYFGVNLATTPSTRSRVAVQRSSRSRWTSRTACATARSVTRPATSSGSSRRAEPPDRPPDRD